MKLFKSIVVVLVLLSGFTACKKYPEGPTLSLRSKAERVANTWKCQSVTENGTDVTSFLTNINYTETYTKDGVYSYTSSLGSGSGKWEFGDKKEDIKRSGVSGQSSDKMTILKLKESEFWYSITDGSDVYVYHMIPA